MLQYVSNIPAMAFISIIRLYHSFVLLSKFFDLSLVLDHEIP